MKHRVATKYRECSCKYRTTSTQAIVYRRDPAVIKTKSNGSIRTATDFKYLGSWIDDSENMRTRKAQAWMACNKLGKIWKSSMRRESKVTLFLATVESVFLYSSETWKANWWCLYQNASHSIIRFLEGHTLQIKICSVTSQKFLARSGKKNESS